LLNEIHENSKHQKPNFKWFDKPFDRLTVLSKVEGLTTLSQPVESLKVERVEGQIPMTQGFRFQVSGQMQVSHLRPISLRAGGCSGFSFYVSLY
jgi:hypothetical protein